MNFRFLGTADSAGIPAHNCACRACELYRKQNRQNLSTCAYIEIDESIILLDAGHDDVASKFDGKNIEAIFLTHFHPDHCLGLLRLRHSTDKIDCFHPNDKQGFSDLFKHKYSIRYKALKSFEKITIKEVSFTTIPLKHSKPTYGYLIEYKNTSIVYLTDCYGIDKSSLEFLKSIKIDLVFIDACYDERRVSGNHLNYIQASDILDSLHVKNGYLIHTSHQTQEYILEKDVKLRYPYVEYNNFFEF